MKPKISIITLGVTDLQKSLEFYRDGLGLELYNYKDDNNIIFFKMEGTWLSLYPKDKLATDVALPFGDDGYNSFTLAYNVQSKKEVETVFDSAVSAGAKPIKKPQDVFWGGFSSYFSDPDGYIWEIAYNPFIDLT